MSARIPPNKPEVLTGPAIRDAVAAGAITVDPFDPKMVNPASINYRLGTEMKVAVGTDGSNNHRYEALDLTPDGSFLLEPGHFYLGHTLEIIGSTQYAMRLIGRSSVGRLGVWVQTSADLGHTTACHQWTLEFKVAVPILLQPEMTLGQVSFWTNFGRVPTYAGVHARHNGAQESLRVESIANQGIQAL